MQGVRTIGLDIAKSVFPVHGIDEASCHDASLAWKRVQRRIISRASSRQSATPKIDTSPVQPGGMMRSISARSSAASAMSAARILLKVLARFRARYRHNEGSRTRAPDYWPSNREP